MKDYSPYQKDEARFSCEVCAAEYLSEELAKQCGAWCREHAEQNPDITKHAVPEDKEGQ